MDGQDLVKLWKDPDAREEAGEDHPSGAMRTRSRVRVGIRAAVLAGVGIGAAIATLETATPTSHTTVSSIWTV